MNQIEKVLFSEDIEDVILSAKDETNLLRDWVNKSVRMNYDFSSLPDNYQKLFLPLLPNIFSFQAFRRIFLFAKFHELINKKRKIKLSLQMIERDKNTHDIPTFDEYSKQYVQKLYPIENEIRYLCYAIILEIRHHEFLNFSSKFLSNYTKEKFEFSKNIVEKLMNDYNDLLIKQANNLLNFPEITKDQKKIIDDIKKNDLYKLKDLNILMGIENEI